MSEKTDDVAHFTTMTQASWDQRNEGVGVKNRRGRLKNPLPQPLPSPKDSLVQAGEKGCESKTAANSFLMAL